MSQPAEKGRLSGTVDGLQIDLQLDCGAWDDEQRQVFSLGDDRGQSDENGDGYVFTFSHFEPMSAMTSATLEREGRAVLIGPAFRAGDDATRWQVDETTATFDGPSGAAGEMPVSLVIDCARRSDEKAGFTTRVTGQIDGQTIDAPILCDRAQPGSALTAQTRDGEEPQFDLTVWPDGSAAAVTATVAGVDYQLAARGGGSLSVEGDVYRVASSFTGGSKRGAYEVDLSFDCGQDMVASPTTEAAPPARSLPLAILPGQRLTIFVDPGDYAPGDRIEVRDEGPSPRDLILLEAGGAVALTAPAEPNRYRVLYFRTGEDVPALILEIVVQ